jgi:hypothetical protein
MRLRSGLPVCPQWPAASPAGSTLPPWRSLMLIANEGDLRPAIAWFEQLRDSSKCPDAETLDLTLPLLFGILQATKKHFKSPADSSTAAAKKLLSLAAFPGVDFPPDALRKIALQSIAERLHHGFAVASDSHTASRRVSPVRTNLVNATSKSGNPLSSSNFSEPSVFAIRASRAGNTCGVSTSTLALRAEPAISVACCTRPTAWWTRQGELADISLINSGSRIHRRNAGFPRSNPCSGACPGLAEATGPRKGQIGRPIFGHRRFLGQARR